MDRAGGVESGREDAGRTGVLILRVHQGKDSPDPPGRIRARLVSVVGVERCDPERVRWESTVDGVCDAVRSFLEEFVEG
jgi:hypothetical protein